MIHRCHGHFCPRVSPPGLSLPLDSALNQNDECPISDITVIAICLCAFEKCLEQGLCIWNNGAKWLAYTRGRQMSWYPSLVGATAVGMSCLASTSRAVLLKFPMSIYRSCIFTCSDLQDLQKQPFSAVQTKESSSQSSITHRQHTMYPRFHLQTNFGCKSLQSGKLASPGLKTKFVSRQQ